MPGFADALMHPEFWRQFGTGLRDVGNRTVANFAGAPVDLAAMLMRPFGYNVKQPVAGSEWIGAQMERAGLVSTARNPAAEMISAILVPGPDPGAAAMLASMPMLAKTVKLDDISQAARMADAGYEGGWYRGGPEIKNNKKSGDWYTLHEQEAAGYAKRFGDAGDVREYALPSKGILKVGMGYSQRLAHDLAPIVEGWGGKKAKDMAKTLRGYDSQVSGLELWRGMAMNFGEEKAAEAFSKLGFKGVLGHKQADNIQIFQETTARDAKLAQFAKDKLNIDDIMAGVAGLGILGGAALGSDDQGTQ